MVTKKRITGWLPENLVNAVDQVNREIEDRHGLQMTLTDVQRMMCVVYARAALKVLETNEILSQGELEAKFISLLLEKKEREE
jgi:hypothetical protein